MSTTVKTVHTTRQVIENQLLAALDDQSKVAILASQQDLSDLIEAMAMLYRSTPANFPERSRYQNLLDGLVQLRLKAFGTHQFSQPETASKT